MQQRKDPEALAGALGAGTLQDPCAVDIREVLRNQAKRRLCRERHVEQVHRLGARVIFELLNELDRVHGLGGDLDQRLEAYAGLDHRLLAAVGGDRFPASPLRIAGGVR